MLTPKDIQQIKAALQSGHLVRVTYAGGLNELIVYMGVQRDDYYVTSRGLEWLDKDLLDCDAYQIIPRPQYRFKKDMKVRVVYERGIRKLLGMIGIIEDFDDYAPQNICVRFDEGKGLQWLPQEWLCPIVEDEVTGIVPIAKGGKDVSVDMIRERFTDRFASGSEERMQDEHNRDVTKELNNPGTDIDVRSKPDHIVEPNKMVEPVTREELALIVKDIMKLIAICSDTDHLSNSDFDIRTKILDKYVAGDLTTIEDTE